METAKNYITNIVNPDQVLTHFLKIEIDKLDVPIEHNINGILNFLFLQYNDPVSFRTRYLMTMSCLAHSIESNHPKYKQIEFIINTVYDIDNIVNLDDMTKKIILLSSHHLFQDKSVIALLLPFFRVIFDIKFSDKLTFSSPKYAIKIAMGLVEPWKVYLKLNHQDILNKLSQVQDS